MHAVWCQRKTPHLKNKQKHTAQASPHPLLLNDEFAQMTTFDATTPFILLARIQVKPGCVDTYLELAKATDDAVQASEPGMLHHTFDQDPNDPHAFVWTEVYANDAGFVAHVANPPVQDYLKKHAELADGFDVEVYGTVGTECRELMESLGLPLKIFSSLLGYSRVG
jgi:quinol monooxygenase YgiN